jgi:hypothetical protein
MSVVNCKVKFIRPEYKNLKEWIEDPNNVYIGRSGIVFIHNENSNIKERYPKKSSPFANPFKLNKDGNRKEIIQKYKKYIKKRLDSDNDLQKLLLNMKNKNLGCWCHPEPCHGDVLIDLIKKYE